MDSSSCSGTLSADRAGVELRDPIACLCLLSQAGIQGVHRYTHLFLYLYKKYTGKFHVPLSLCVGQN